MVEEIQTGNKFELLFCQPALIYDTAKAPLWIKGVIPEIAASAAMQRLIKRGELPALSREEAHGYFAHPDSGISPAAQKSLNRAIAELCRIRSARLQHASVSVQRAMEEYAQRLEHVTCQLVYDEAELKYFGSFLGQSVSRDCLFLNLIANPDKACVMLRAIAQTFNGAVRANALALYAVVSINTVRQQRIPLALQEALLAVPYHSLSSMLMQAYTHGLISTVQEPMCEGCVETLMHMGATTRYRELLWNQIAQMKNSGIIMGDESNDDAA